MDKELSLYTWLNKYCSTDNYSHKVSLTKEEEKAALLLLKIKTNNGRKEIKKNGCRKPSERRRKKVRKISL